MMDLITYEQFERARQAFAEGWEEEDNRQVATDTEIAGARTAAGLAAALHTLGIKVAT